MPETLDRPTRGFAWLAFALLLAGAALRLGRLDGMALFVDEGGHILAPADPRLREAMNPIGDYKPGMLWVFAPATALPFDPLTTARAMSAVAGLVTALLIAGVLWLASGAAAAVAGVAIWSLLPLAVFHERLALLDPFVACFVAAALAVAVAAGRPETKRRLLLGGLAGALLGAAFAVKSSALLTLPWLALVYAAIQCGRERSPGSWRFVAALVLGAALALAPLGTQLLHLGEQTRLHALPTFDGAVGFAAKARQFAAATGAHFASIVRWLFGYGGWPLAVLLATAAALSIQHRDRRAAMFAGAWVLALITASLAYPQPYARYLLVDQIPLALFLGQALSSPRRSLSGGGNPGRRIALAAAGLALTGWLWANVQIARDPRRAPIPADEIAQYTAGRWSAAGFAKATAFLRDRTAATHAPVVVFTPLYSRPGVYCLLLAAQREPNLVVVPLDLGSNGPLAVGAIRAAVTRARAALGPRLGVFMLFEGLRSDEAATLRSLGLRCTPVVEDRHADGVSGFALLECDPATL